MPLVNNGKNLALDALAAAADYGSLHTGTPSGAGSNEVTGGAPAYARKALTWGAASGGSVAITNSPVFDVPTGTTVKFVGFWSALSTGTFYGYGAITDEVFGSQGTLTLNTLTVTASDS